MAARRWNALPEDDYPIEPNAGGSAQEEAAVADKVLLSNADISK